MAVVKIKFIRHAGDLIKYVLKDHNTPELTDCHDCSPKTAPMDFEMMRQLHNGKGEINAIHVVQSWNEEESKRVPTKVFTEMGRELVEKKFPGHAFLIVTHTDTAKTHNHIVVCPWHSETGKKIENKKHHLYTLRDFNDQISKDRGLSVINRDAKERSQRTPDKVVQMMKWQGRSYILDMCQKMDFARSISTSYDEYVGTLSLFGVHARVENKNITYFYNDKPKGKRGANLGKNYDKLGLEQTFKANDEKFKARPSLKQHLSGLSPAEFAKNYPESSIQKDYGKFTKTERSERREYPHELDLRGSIIPRDQIMRARYENIPRYCDRNRIELNKEHNGVRTLKGKEFVEISDYNWVNKRNNTKGSLIEFVAAHKNMTYLQAIADINSNKSLLLLEKHFGETRRNFTSFYVPNEKQLERQHAVGKATELFTHLGIDHRLADSLHRSGQLHVSKEGIIRLFGKDDDSGAFEFTQDNEGKWNKKQIGKFHKPFFEANKNSSDAVIYLDPFSFLKSKEHHFLNKSRFGVTTTCLSEPSEKHLDLFLIEHPQARKIEFVIPKDHELSKEHIDLFQFHQEKYKNLGKELSLTHEVSGRSRDRGFSISL